MGIIFLKNGVLRTRKALKRMKNRRNCILTKCREELYFETDVNTYKRDDFSYPGTRRHYA